MAVITQFIRAGIRVLESLLQSRAVNMASAMAGAKLVEQYLGCRYEFFMQRNVSEFVRSVTVTVDKIYRTLLMSICYIISDVCVVVILMGAMMIADPVVTLSTGFFLITVSLFFITVTRKHYSYWGMEVQNYSRSTIETMLQAFNSIKYVIVGGHAATFAERFRQQRIALSTYIWKVGYYAGLPRLLIEAAANLAGILLIFVMYVRSGDLASSLPLLSFLAYSALRLLPSIGRLITNSNQVFYGLAALDIPKHCVA